MEQHPQENKMGVMPVGKLLFSMSLPMMLSMMVQALYNVVDSIFVARIGEDALTALSMAFPLQNLMIAMVSGVGVGINALLSRALGAKQSKTVRSVATNGIFLVVMVALLFMVLGVVITEPFFRVQTDIASIAMYGKTYTSIALAVRALKNKEVRRIILSRPAVEAGEKLGFLPGDMKEKIDPYLQPLYDALQDMIPAQKLQEYMDRTLRPSKSRCSSHEWDTTQR